MSLLLRLGTDRRVLYSAQVLTEFTDFTRAAQLARNLSLCLIYLGKVQTVWYNSIQVLTEFTDFTRAAQLARNFSLCLIYLGKAQTVGYNSEQVLNNIH